MVLIVGILLWLLLCLRVLILCLSLGSCRSGRGGRGCSWFLLSIVLGVIVLRTLLLWFLLSLWLWLLWLLLLLVVFGIVVSVALLCRSLLCCRLWLGSSSWLSLSLIVCSIGGLGLVLIIIILNIIKENSIGLLLFISIVC